MKEISWIRVDMPAIRSADCTRTVIFAWLISPFLCAIPPIIIAGVTFLPPGYLPQISRESLAAGCPDTGLSHGAHRHLHSLHYKIVVSAFCIKAGSSLRIWHWDICRFLCPHQAGKTMQPGILLNISLLFLCCFSYTFYKERFCFYHIIIIIYNLQQKKKKYFCFLKIFLDFLLIF